MAEPQFHRQLPEDGAMRPGASASATLAADRTIPAQYDLLLAKFSLADHELELNGVSGRAAHLEEASGIVFDLLYSLDFKNGGELVPRLAALYGYIGNELLNIGRSGDRVQLGHLRDMIETLKQSW
jgi:flagellin-specific chaperone FliS